MKLLLPLASPKKTKSLSPFIPSIENCDEIFPQILGTEPGLLIFRIENMLPELINKSKYGCFCVADCYIVVFSFEKKSTSGNDSNLLMLDHKIWIWIGNQCEMDKRFCVAMYANGVKNWIGSSQTIQREVGLFKYF